MTNTLKKLNLVLLPTLLQDSHSLLPLLRRERMIVFRAREEQRLVQLLKLFIGQSARMGKCARGDEALGRQGVEHVGGAEAVTNASVLGGLLAVGCGNGFGPFWDGCKGEGDMFVAPGCVVEARICGLVVFVFAVLPYWIL